MAFRRPGMACVFVDLSSCPLAQMLHVDSSRLPSPPSGAPSDPQRWQAFLVRQSTSTCSTDDRRAPGSRLARKLATEHLEQYLSGPGGCPGWQPLCGLSPGFQGAKAKPGQEFLALILPLIPPRNEACQSSNSRVFMRRLW